VSNYIICCCFQRTIKLFHFSYLRVINNRWRLGLVVYKRIGLDQSSYPVSGLASTGIDNRLRADKPCRYITIDQDQLNSYQCQPSLDRRSEYQQHLRIIGHWDWELCMAIWRSIKRRKISKNQEIECRVKVNNLHVDCDFWKYWISAIMGKRWVLLFLFDFMLQSPFERCRSEAVLRPCLIMYIKFVNDAISYKPLVRISPNWQWSWAQRWTD